MMSCLHYNQTLLPRRFGGQSPTFHFAALTVRVLGVFRGSAPLARRHFHYACQPLYQPLREAT